MHESSIASIVFFEAWFLLLAFKIATRHYGLCVVLLFM